MAGTSHLADPGKDGTERVSSGQAWPFIEEGG
jgi:hypothetical protein